MKRFGRIALQALASLLGVFVLLSLTLLALRVPLGAGLAALWNGAIGNAKDGFWYPISETLVETCPLLLAGLGVGIAWRAGMFSIGGEGQLLMGGLAATVVWRLFGAFPIAVLMPIMLICGAFAGSFWAAIAGWLRVKRNVPEAEGYIVSWPSICNGPTCVVASAGWICWTIAVTPRWPNGRSIAMS